MKRADEITNNFEAKRPKMDVPPPNCLRTRRPGGRGGASDAESRLGSMSGQFPDAAGVPTQEKTDSESADQIIETSEPQTSQATSITSTTTEATSSKVIIKPPKQLLNEYYAKLQIKSTKDQYTTVKHDKVVKFASVFTCPTTSETFMGGRMKGVEYLEENGIVWYGKSLLSYICIDFPSSATNVISIEQINHLIKPTNNWRPQP